MIDDAPIPKDKVVNEEWDKNRKQDDGLFDRSPVFILYDRDSEQPVLTRHDDQISLCLFPNKLDAIILMLLTAELVKRINKETLNLEVILLHEHPYFKEEVNACNKIGKLQLAIMHGFLRFNTPMGIRWARFKDDIYPVSPFLTASVSVEFIEQGVNPHNYLLDITDPQEKEIALSNLIKTNLTPLEKLKDTAKEIIEHIEQERSITVERNSLSIYPSHCFVG